MWFRSTLTLGLLAAAMVLAQSFDDDNHDNHALDMHSPLNFTVPQEIFERQLQQNPNFDIYTLQMFWWPGHCAASGTSTIPLCNEANKPPAAWQSQLVVHGLWPSYSDTFKTTNKLQVARPDGLKGKCAGAAYVPPADLDPNAGASTSGNAKAKPNPKATTAKGKGKAPATATNSYFVDLPAGDKSGTPSKANQVIFPGRGVSNKQPDFYNHEYDKHGRCSGLTQAQYFAQSVALGNQMNAKVRPLNLKPNAKTSLSVIQAKLGHDVALGCVPKKQQLWYVNFCFEHTGKGVVGAAVRCPTETVNPCVVKGGAKDPAINLR